MTQPRRFYAWREVLADVRAFFDEVERNDVSVIIERHGRPAYLINPHGDFHRGVIASSNLAEAWARFAADELVRAGQEIERTVARDGSADYERPRTRDDVHRVRKHTTSPIGDPDVEPSCDHVMRVRGCVACDLKWANAGPL